MSDYGFKMSKTGKSAKSTDPDDFMFHSEFSTRSIKLRDSIELTTSDEDFPLFVSVEYVHDFGYIPQFMAFTKSYSSENFGKFALADYVNLNISLIHEIAGANLYEDVRAYATDTKLIVEGRIEEVVAGFAEGVEHTYTIDFMLFMEEAVPLS
jgi:hypothetical protein